MSYWSTCGSALEATGGQGLGFTLSEMGRCGNVFSSGVI